MKFIRARLEFKAEDLWVSLFWTRVGVKWFEWRNEHEPVPCQAFQKTARLCLVPCLPLHVDWYTFPKDK